ncbi:MAG TPA: glycosyltransferase family A protein [Chitinophagaceae bacterium]|nr:glycosyltransferase family A protein [Chitinophagaceae bacterium]
MPPFFSVIIPTYNRAHLIGKTLESLVRQEFKDFEIIVVDDGGTDNTKEVVEGFKDNRIKYYWKENAERGAARNFGASKASGKYLNFFDSDDLAYPQHLLISKKIIEENNSPAVFHLGYEMRSPSGDLIKKNNSVGNSAFKELLIRSYLSMNSVFLKYDVWNEIRFNEDRKLVISEDWLFYLKLAVRYGWASFDENITSCIVQHSKRSMNTTSGDACVASAKIFKNSLEEDKLFSEKLSTSQKNIIFAEPISVAALRFAVEKKKIKSIKTFAKAASLNYKTLFTKRTLAIIKHLLFNW